MIERKTYIPSRPRNKKLVLAGGSSVSLRSNTTSGTGMTPEQLQVLNNLASWWKLDEEGNLYTDLSLYSKREISAYDKGSGGLVIPPFEIVDPAAGQALQFNGTHWVNVPWPGGGGSNVSWGTTANGYSPLTVEGVAKTVALSGHAHAASDITSGIIAVARLGSGTPSASNFLRGDGTWATPAGTTYTGSTSIILSGTSFQRAALTGDVTSPQNSNALILANSGVTAGTYNNVATQVRPFTVDAKGRVTGIGTAVTITPAWNSITNTPTTLSEYGISGTDTLFDNKYLKLTGGTLTGDLHTPGVSLIGASNGIRFTKTDSPAYWAWINNDNRLTLGNGASATSMSIDNVGNIGAPAVLTALDASYFLQNGVNNPFLRLRTTSDIWYLQASEANHSAYLSNELGKGIRVSKEGYLGINVFDNYADADFISFHLRGGHSSTRFRMEAQTGQTGMNSNSILSMWASEPDATYSGAGIGENVKGSPHSGGRVNTARGAAYIRFIEGQTVFGGINTAGTLLDGVRISFGGNIQADGEITAYVASDRRLKTGISPIFNALNTVDRLCPVMYYWNEKAMELNPLKTKGTDFGLIAQEVEGVLPGVIHDVYGDYKAIDYVKLIPFLIGAIKELRKEVKSLNIK